MTLATIDVVVIVCYAIGIFSLAQYVAREKKGHEKDTSDYFLASKNLPWWAIGASLIAANISAEQIVGMSGSGYALGLAIASYEASASGPTSTASPSPRPRGSCAEPLRTRASRNYSATAAALSCSQAMWRA